MFWLEVLTDQACVIVSIDRRTPATILLVLQANECRRKEHQRPKARAKASYNSVLLEGNIDDYIVPLFVKPFVLLWMLCSGNMYE